MRDHPQIKAFNEAASMLRAERYWDLGSTEEHVEFLRALGEVLTEVCYTWTPMTCCRWKSSRQVRTLQPQPSEGCPCNPRQNSC